MEEGKENFENNPGENIEREIEEAKDVDLMEFSLDKDEIEELILRLQLLKEEKGSVSFEIDDENELLIHYEKEEEEEVEEEEE